MQLAGLAAAHSSLVAAATHKSVPTDDPTLTPLLVIFRRMGSGKGKRREGGRGREEDKDARQPGVTPGTPLGQGKGGPLGVTPSSEDAGTRGGGGGET